MTNISNSPGVAPTVTSESEPPVSQAVEDLRVVKRTIKQKSADEDKPVVEQSFRRIKRLLRRAEMKLSDTREGNDSQAVNQTLKASIRLASEQKEPSKLLDPQESAERKRQSAAAMEDALNLPKSSMPNLEIKDDAAS